MKERLVFNENGKFSFVVSIHAPVKERRKGGVAFVARSGFNSRSREGATYTRVLGYLRKKVSIHAPVKERRKSFT